MRATLKGTDDSIIEVKTESLKVVYVRDDGDLPLDVVRLIERESKVILAERGGPPTGVIMSGPAAA